MVGRVSSVLGGHLAVLAAIGLGPQSTAHGGTLQAQQILESTPEVLVECDVDDGIEHLHSGHRHKNHENN